jgi:polysaccharide biosynthesis protein PslH
MNILFLTAYPPVLNMHGGGVRMYHNIRILAEKHSVRVLSFFDTDEDREALKSLEGICESAEAIPRFPEYSPHWFSLAPFLIHEFNLPEMRAAVDREIRKRKPDVMQCEYLQMAQYRRPDIFTVLTLHEMLSLNAREVFARENNPLEKLRLFHRWMTMLNCEIGGARRVNRVVTMTENDARYLQSYLPKSDIKPIPIGIDTDFFSPCPEEEPATIELLFVGNFRHTPNVEAAEFIVKYIVPRFPKLKVTFAGSYVPEHIKREKGICLTGHVSDTRLLYRRPNTIVVAPLFSGTGQRVKLLEAFSMAVPVVTTSLGAAGFPVTNEKEVMLAETPGEFVDAIDRLAGSVKIRVQLGSHARRMMIERYTWKQIAEKFDDAVRTQ